MLCVTMTIVKSRLSSVHEVLDARGGDRVERRARLVHEHHVGLAPRARARCTAAAADHPTARDALFFSLSLTSSHSAARVERLLDDVVELARFVAVDAAGRTRCCRRSTSGTGSASGTPCRCGAAPRPGRPSGRRGPRRGTAILPLHLGARGEVVHAVEAAQHGGLAAPRRADERGDLVARRCRGRRRRPRRGRCSSTSTSRSSNTTSRSRSGSSSAAVAPSERAVDRRAAAVATASIVRVERRQRVGHRRRCACHSSATSCRLPAGEERRSRCGPATVNDEHDQDERERRAQGPLLGGDERLSWRCRKICTRQRGVRAVEEAPVRSSARRRW